MRFFSKRRRAATSGAAPQDLHALRAQRREQLISVRAAAGSVVESLETRLLFGRGFGSLYLPGSYAPQYCPRPSSPTAEAPQTGGGGDVVAAGDPDSPDTVAPVMYANGQVIYNSTDLSATGIGGQFDWTRTWTSMNNGGPTGNGWTISALPYMTIVQNQFPGEHGGIVEVALGGQNQRRFDVGEDDSDFTGRYWSQDTLTYTAPTSGGGGNVAGAYTLSDTAGNGTSFYDLARTTDEAGTNLATIGRIYAGDTYSQQVTSDASDTPYRYGAYKGSIDRYGNTTAAVYDGSGNMTELIRTDAVTGAQQEYAVTYGTVTNSLGGSVVLASTVTLKHRANSGAGWVTDRSATYDYYTGETSGADAGDGRLGDLKLVTIKDAGGSVIDHKYYRYNKLFTSELYTNDAGFNGPETTGGTDDSLYDSELDGSANLIMSGLKSTFEGAAYARLTGAMGTSVASLSDAAVANYADNTFSYGQVAASALESGRHGNLYYVTYETAAGNGCTTCSGGFGTYKLEYQFASFDMLDPAAINSNLVYTRTTEYLPDETADTWADNDQQYVCTNAFGEVILKVLIDKHQTSDPSDDTLEAWGFEYDEQGRKVMTAHPSAFNLSDADAVAGLMNGAESSYFDPLVYANHSPWLQDHAGEIDRFFYSKSSSASLTDGSSGTNNVSGDALGYLRNETVQQGQLDGAVTPTGISRSGTTATITFATAPGFSVGDMISISSSDYAEYNGEFVLLSSSGAGKTFTFKISADPGANTTSSSIRVVRPTLLDKYAYFTRTDGIGGTIHPVASYTQYHNTDGTGARTTSYDYAWYSGTLAEKSRTTTMPLVSAGQNGPGTYDRSTDYFDNWGRTVFHKDGDGYISFNKYDATGIGGLVKTIQDVDTSTSSDFTDGYSPTSFASLSSVGGTRLRLTSAYTVDGLGRTTGITDPNGNNAFITYNDVNHETRTYSGWHAVGTLGTNTLYNTTGPVQIQREYRPGAGVGTSSAIIYQESLTATILSHTGNPTGSENFSSGGTSGGTVQSLSRDITNSAGQLVETDRYVNFGTNAYSTAVRIGAANTNYYATKFAYDTTGGVKRLETPTGTVTRTVYDAAGRVLSTWVGTDDTPVSGFWSPANAAGMTKVSQNVYFEARVELPPPAAPTVSQTAGSIDDPGGDFKVRVSYVYAAGQTHLSDDVDLTVDAEYRLTVASPASAANVIGYNVWLLYPESTTWMRQNETPISIGTPWTMDEGANYANYGQFDGTPTAVGDGNVLLSIQYPTDDLADARITQYFYDWRDRVVAAKNGVGLDAFGRPTTSGDADGTHRLITYNTYGNLSEVTETKRYAGDGVTITTPTSGASTGIPAAPSSSQLRRKATFSYDDQGHQYRSDTYSVTPNGTNAATVGTNTLSSQMWYDHRGNVMSSAQPGGLVSKYAYDGAGRVITQYASDGGVTNVPSTWQNWTNAASVANDIVVQQTDTTYDANGNVTLTKTRQRFHDDATNGAGLGSLVDPSNNPKARVSYTASYYDAANRLTDSVDVGTNGTNGAYSRPGSAPTNRTDALLLTHTDYNDAGWADTVTDPRGIKAKTLYDMLGRTTSSIQAYDAAVNSGNPSDQNNQTTAYTYDGMDHVLTMTAVMPTGTPSQTTEYVYGVTTSMDDTHVNSNDLLRQVRYPDASTGNASTNAASVVTYGYNAAGQQTRMTDQNGTLHVYAYDALGRNTWAGGVAGDVVTVASGNPQNVSTNVLQLAFSYNDAGQAYLFTSYNSTGTVVNQVQRTFNGLGQLVTEYQEHSGGVNAGTSQKVQYAYSEMSGGANHSRLTSMTYPNGRVLNYLYGSGLDSSISRLTSLSEGSGTNAAVLEGYSYLGLGAIVKAAHPGNGIDLTYIKQSGEANGDAGDQYTGLDRFGRVVDQRYLDTASGTNLTATDRFKYGYDRDSNVLFKNNILSSANSELYHASSTAGGYDLLNRLTGFARGTLSDANSDGAYDTVSTATRTQAWNLDQLGNWSGTNAVTTDGTAQSRTTNSKNELTNVGGNTLTFDNDGNTTTDETGKQFVYDPWNRLVTVKNSGGTTLATYQYDALGRKVSENPGTQTDLYYGGNSDWQLLEEKQGSTTKSQNVWSRTYIDDLVLRDRDADNSSGTGNLGKSSSGLEERLYTQHDANHNVTAISNTSGAVQERFLYDPYGSSSVLTSAWASGSDSKAWAFRFQGGRLDGTSGFEDFRNRQYSPTLGRWLQRDPTGYVDGGNLYQFVLSSPLAKRDPNGTDSNSPSIKDASGITFVTKEELLEREAAAARRRADQAYYRETFFDKLRAALRGFTHVCPPADDALLAVLLEARRQRRAAEDAADKLDDELQELQNPTKPDP